MNHIKSPCHPSVAEFLSSSLAAAGKTPDQLASECGLRTSHAAAWLLAGTAKIPLDLVEGIADCIKVERDELKRRVISEYFLDLDGAGIDRSPTLSSDQQLRPRDTGSEGHGHATAALVPDHKASRTLNLRFTVCRHPDQGWVVIANKQADGVMRGDSSLGELAGLAVPFVLVFVGKDDAGSLHFGRIEAGAWPFRADGYLDQDAVFQQAVRALHGQESRVPLEEADIAAIKQAIRNAMRLRGQLG